jgi:hypothetical protein
MGIISSIIPPLSYFKSLREGDENSCYSEPASRWHLVWCLQECRQPEAHYGRTGIPRLAGQARPGVVGEDNVSIALVWNDSLFVSEPYS